MGILAEGSLAEPWTSSSKVWIVQTQRKRADVVHVDVNYHRRYSGSLAFFEHRGDWNYRIISL